MKKKFNWLQKAYYTVTGRGQMVRDNKEYHLLRKQAEDNLGFTDQEYERARELLDRYPDLRPGQQERIEVLEHDYSHYAGLNPVYKGVLAHQKARELMGRMNSPVEELAAALEPLDPVVRKAVSTAKNNQFYSDFKTEFDQLDRALTNKVVNNYFKPLDNEARQRVQAEYADEGPQAQKAQREIAESTGLARGMGQWRHLPGDADEAERRHLAQQRAMLKLYTMAQLGDFTVKTDGQPTPWNDNMSDIFGNGARTTFVFPDSGQEKDQLGEIFAPTRAERESMGMFKRAGATHSVVQARKDPQNPTSLQGLEERKGFFQNVRNLFLNITNYGMDIAMGGLGAQGIGGPGGEKNTIMNDGRNGHFYIGFRPETGSKKATMLIGLESDAPYRCNATGHMHTMAAVGEENASSGGMKTDLIGDKYGARTVNLSGIGANDLSQVLAKIDTLTPAQMEAMSRRVTGKPMDDNEMSAVLRNDLGLDDSTVNSISAQRNLIRQANPAPQVQAPMAAPAALAPESITMNDLMEPTQVGTTQPVAHHDRQEMTPRL